MSESSFYGITKKLQIKGHVHIAIFKMDSQQGPIVSTRELFSMLCQPGWRGVWWRLDTCICMAESLHCSHETTTILLISYVFVLVAQSCPTLCDPMDCSPPSFSVHGILQARILEWIAIPFSGGTSQPRDWTLVFCLTGRFFTIWATGKSITQ